MDILKAVEQEFLRERYADIMPGDYVKAHLQIREGDRVRIQVFEGTVIARRGTGLGESITIRRLSYGVGVERVLPVHSPRIENIELVRRGKVRRAKLYYLRERVGKKARVKEKLSRKERLMEENLPEQEELPEELPQEEAQVENQVETPEAQETQEQADQE